MLHYYITGEKILSPELQYASLADKERLSESGTNVLRKSTASTGLNTLGKAAAPGANASRVASDAHIPDPSGEHPGIWLLEQALLNMIREGNPNYKDALAKSESLSSGLRYHSTDAVPSVFIVVGTLARIASVFGKVVPSPSRFALFHMLSTSNLLAIAIAVSRIAASPIHTIYLKSHNVYLI